MAKGVVSKDDLEELLETYDISEADIGREY